MKQSLEIICYYADFSKEEIKAIILFLNNLFYIHVSS